ncbi:MAG: TatD family hydrolase [Candidatus Bathyarchaeia archaeon]
MRLIDAHCHLNLPEFDKDRTRVVEDARKSGVVAIIDETDMASVEEAKSSIRNMVETIKRNPAEFKVESPISVVAKITKLRSEGERGKESAYILDNLIKISEEVVRSRNTILEWLYREQRDEDSRFHYLQRRLEELTSLEYAAAVCPVCGRLVEVGEPSFGAKHPVCSDCLVKRTEEVIAQLNRNHPEMLTYLEDVRKEAESYLKRRKKAI